MYVQKQKNVVQGWVDGFRVAEKNEEFPVAENWVGDFSGKENKQTVSRVQATHTAFITLLRTTYVVNCIPDIYYESNE